MQHILSILVDNEFGALARIVGLFSGRGYNIESLSVAEVDEDNNLSRITVVTNGTPMVIEQIKNLLERLVPVHYVRDLTAQGEYVARELAIIKVSGVGENRVEALRMADIFRAKVVDATSKSFIFEITGSTEKVSRFIDLMKPVGMVEVSRTGVTALPRGCDSMS